jgi:hypothetical protein
MSVAEDIMITAFAIKKVIEKKDGLSVPEICKRIDSDDSNFVREIVETLDSLGEINFISNRCYFVEH